MATRHKYKSLDIDRTDLHICNYKIDTVTAHKYLGLVIDCVLSFEEHFDYLQKNHF